MCRLLSIMLVKHDIIVTCLKCARAISDLKSRASQKFLFQLTIMLHGEKV